MYICSRILRIMKLSIITINYNNALGLRKTLNSVAQQIFLPATTLHSPIVIEHVIIDGASTDGSVEVIKEYVQRIKNDGTKIEVIWLSEPDKGIYNAMNKGIRMATGDYIQILNSGDFLASDNVLKQMFEAMRREGAKENGTYPEMMYGNMIRRRADGTIEGKSGEVPYSLLQYFTSTMNHDCCWIKRSLFLNENNDELCYGLYDENLKIVSDWKWFLQAIGLGKVQPVYVDIDVTVFDTSGISEKNLKLRQEERRIVLEDVLPRAVLSDYDKHAFDIQQMDNLRKHTWAYRLVWILERVLNRVDNKNFKKPKNR